MTLFNCDIKAQKRRAVAMIALYFLWFYLICSYYVAPGELFNAQAWERVCRLQLLLNKLCTTNHTLFVSTAGFASIGGTILEVKSAL